MRNRFISSLAATLVLATVSASAIVGQTRPYFYGSWDFIPFAGVKAPPAGFETFEVRALNPIFEINIPKRIGPGLTLTNGIRYSGVLFESQGTAPAGGVVLPSNLHDIMYRLALRFGIGGLWSVEAVAEPGINSDLKNFDSDHLRYEGALLFNTDLPGLGNIGFGGILTNDFGGDTRPLPAFNLDLVLSQFKTAIDLPRSLGLFLVPTPSIEFGFAGAVRGGEYAMGAITGAPDAVTRYSSITAGPSINIRLSGNSFFSIEGGLATNRRLELYDNSTSSLRELDLKSGPFLNVKLDIRPGGGSNSDDNSNSETNR